MAWIACNILVLFPYGVWWINILISEFRYYTSPYLLSKTLSQYPSFSIIIAYRDESERIQPLLQSLVNIHYRGDWEIILVNDHSSDQSPQIINEWIQQFPLLNVRHFDSIASGKKAAIDSGIKQAKYSWIATTDADCKIPSNWLESLAVTINENPPSQMIIGRIRYEPAEYLHTFSTYELLENQFLLALNWLKTRKQKLGFANAANLCYSKDLYLQLGGMQSHLNIASGDDTFTAEKFHRNNPNSIVFNPFPNACITTYTLHHFSDFCQQRIRWFKKSFLQKSQKNTLEQAILAFMLLSLWGLTIWAVYAGYGIYAILPLASKAIIDYFCGSILLIWNQNFQTSIKVILKKAIHIQQLRIIVASFLQSILLPLLGIIAPFVHFKWKNRPHKA